MGVSVYRVGRNQPIPVPQPPMDRRAGRRGVLVPRSVDAVMLIEELVGHQRLVGHVGLSDQRRRGAWAGIQLGPNTVISDRRNIVVVEQVAGRAATDHFRLSLATCDGAEAPQGQQGRQGGQSKSFSVKNLLIHG